MNGRPCCKLCGRSAERHRVRYQPAGRGFYCHECAVNRMDPTCEECGLTRRTKVLPTMRVQKPWVVRYCPALGKVLCVRCFDQRLDRIQPSPMQAMAVHEFLDEIDVPVRRRDWILSPPERSPDDS